MLLYIPQFNLHSTSCPNHIPHNNFLGPSPIQNQFSDFFFFFEHAVCWILVPRPRIEPRPPAVEVRSLNHWTTKDFLEAFFSSILIFLKNISQLSKVLQVILAWCFLRTRSKSGAFLAGASQMRLCSS